MHVCVCVERAKSQSQQKNGKIFFQKIKTTGYASLPSITITNPQRINQLLQKKVYLSLCSGRRQLMLLQLCQGITSWLAHEAEEKASHLWSRHKSERKKKKPSLHYILGGHVPSHPKASHSAPLLTHPTASPQLLSRVQVFATLHFRSKLLALWWE